MSNFFVQIIEKSVKNDLAKSTEKNWLDALLKNPMIKGLLKSYLKDISEGLTNGEQDLIRLFESIELLPGETQVAPFFDVDFNAEGKKEIRLIVAAFENSTLKRVITDVPLRDYITEYLHKKVK